MSCWFPAKKTISTCEHTPGSGISISFAYPGEAVPDASSIDDFAAQIRNAGADILEGPVDRPWNTRDLVVADPKVLSFSLLSGLYMNEIVSGVKRNDGILVVWKDGDDMKSIFFEYEALIDMKINALDLIDHPGMYFLDPGKRSIVQKCGMGTPGPCQV
jgi:hypothetical protein